MIRDYCLIYHPVYTSKADTAETRRQANGNNAAFDTLCDKHPVK